jgi:single-strand DNA-binding protein
MRYAPSGDAVTKFTIATTARWTSKDGENQEDTTWFNVSVWGRQAEPCNQYLSKGSLAVVEGEIRTRQYEQDGQTKYWWEIRARNVRFIRGPSGDQRRTGELEAMPGGLSDIDLPESDEVPF